MYDASRVLGLLPTPTPSFGKIISLTEEISGQSVRCDYYGPHVSSLPVRECAGSDPAATSISITMDTLAFD
jgi:hypothetical protein